MERPTGFGLRPRSIGEMLDLIFQVYRSGFSVFAALGIMVALLRLAVGLAWSSSVGRLVVPGMAPADAGGLLLAFTLTLPLLLVASVAIYALGAVSITAAAEDAFFGRPVTLRSALTRARGRILPAACSALLCWILTSAGMLLCCLPGFAALIVWSLAVPLVYLERASVSASLSRSWDLVLRRGPRGLSEESNWVRILVIGFMTFLVYGLMSVLSEGPLTAVSLISTLQSKQPTMTALGPQFAPLGVVLPLQVVGAAIQGLFIPLIVIPWPLVYFDIRTRHEGLDLERAAASLGSDDRPLPPAPVASRELGSQDS